MVNELTVAEFAHVLFGAMWVGAAIYIEAVLLPIQRKAKTGGEFRPLLPVLGKTSGFQAISGLLVLVSGVIYMLLKYQPLGAILTVSSGQLIIVALVLVLGTMVSGFAFLRPTAKKIATTPWPEDPSAPVPESVRHHERRLEMGSLLNTIVVVIVLLLMVIAATGGL